ncbi:sugar phosphate nucleotidyltransferase [Oleidesulfovibrio sp.]|uniref:sugar phosphate nucleotidyltransferase n=1 Tax=Oleidesulfovibrio sp. TaxID=2909707 RepID=UPI003A8C5528
MKVIILCGGKGTRILDEVRIHPNVKANTNSRPPLWHIMDIFARHGFKDFILPLGYKGDQVKKYFSEYTFLHSDFTIDLATGHVTPHGTCPTDWTVTLCDAGQDTLKGARIKSVAHHIDSPRFMVTYGDGVADIDIKALLDFHMRSGNIGTFTGVRTPPRIGSVQTDATGNILSWQQTPLLNEYISCGFFVFESVFLDYLSDDPCCDLEGGPLERLAAEGQLGMYLHKGFWHCTAHRAPQVFYTGDTSKKFAA